MIINNIILIIHVQHYYRPSCSHVTNSCTILFPSLGLFIYRYESTLVHLYMTHEPSVRHFGSLESHLIIIIP